MSTILDAPLAPVMKAPRSRQRTIALLVMLVAVAAWILIVALTSRTTQQTINAVNTQGKFNERVSLLDQLYQYLLDAETGQRGYLLTGDAQYLAPYENATKMIPSTMSKIRDSVALSPEQLEQLALVSRTMQRKLGEMELSLELRRRDPSGALARTVLDTDFGRRYMEEIRQGLSQIEAAYIADAATSTSVLHGLIDRFRWAIILASTIALIGFCAYVWQREMLLAKSAENTHNIEQERMRLQSLVAQRTEHLDELASRLIRQDEATRHRIAREMHDELGALLTAAKFEITRIRSKMGSSPAPDSLQRLDSISRLLDDGIGVKRRIIEDLHPSSLERLGLNAALNILTQEFARRTGVEVLASIQPVKLSDETALAVFRIVQESLTNVSKYASARTVVVSLYETGSVLTLVVRDDGVGFDLEARAKASFGLGGMRQRATLLGGELNIISSPGNGTQVMASIPLTTDNRAQPESPDTGSQALTA
jgi:signal transduction histidine kinase